MKRDDAGFTLPELLVAVVVAAIVMPAVSMALINAFRTTAGTTDRLAASNDAQMTSSWFIPDVQSADEFGSTDIATCPSPGTTLLFTASRTDGADALVTGYATLDTATERTLIRYRCVNGSAQPTVTVGHDLDTTALPAVTCTPSPCGAATTHVSVTVTDASGYTFGLNAQRRTS